MLRCVGGDGGESNSPSRKFHWSASTCVAAGTTLPAADTSGGTWPRHRLQHSFFDDAHCVCIAAPQGFGARSVCLRCTPTDVAGQLCRSEGDFSFASCVVARFNVDRRHGTQPRATLPVEPTRPHVFTMIQQPRQIEKHPERNASGSITRRAHLLQQLENPVQTHRLGSVTHRFRYPPHYAS